MSPIHWSNFSARGPSSFIVKLRDKLAPNTRLSIRTTDGYLPYARTDLVAMGIAGGTFERGELAAAVRVLPACRGVIDVGANLGLYTLLAAKRLAARGTVISFEASPIEYEKLKWTVKRNSLTNVVSVLSAVSDRDGETVIFQSTSGAGALNRVDRPGKETGDWRVATVPMTSIDTWLRVNPHEPIDLLKVDVEGHELPVLRGARQLLARDWPAVMIEINDARASEVSDPAKIWQFVRDAGYDWYEIDDVGNAHPAREGVKTVNLFALHPETSNPAVADLLLGRGRG